MTGVTSAAINHLPYLLLLVAGIGLAQAEWLRRFRPAAYRQIGKTRLEEGSESTADTMISSAESQSPTVS